MQLLHDPCASVSCRYGAAGSTLDAMMNSTPDPRHPGDFRASTPPLLAFVGGGNMASAILGGLVAAGHPADRVVVVEPHAPQARRRS